MAYVNIETRLPMNLDYFSMSSPQPPQGPKQKVSTKSTIRGASVNAYSVQQAGSYGVGSNNQNYERPSLSWSSNSSPVENFSPISNQWDISSYNELPILSSYSCDSSALSPSQPPSPTSIHNSKALKQTPEILTGGNNNVDSIITFDDWMRLDSYEAGEASLSPGMFPKLEPASPDMFGTGNDLTTSNDGLQTVGFQDQSSLEQEALFQSPSVGRQQIETAQSGSQSGKALYLWERSKTNTDIMSTLNSDTTVNNNNNLDFHPISRTDITHSFQPPRLTRAQESNLQSIAMPQLNPQRQVSILEDTLSNDSCSREPSPEPVVERSSRKRKASSRYENSSSASSSAALRDKSEKSSVSRGGRKIGSLTGKAAPPVKKAAHNMIEKRYRTNLNDKIAALRDSVPCLRAASTTAAANEESGKSAKAEDGDDEELSGLSPAGKLNKATVLSKATEYIAHLEKRTKHLASENRQLKMKLDAFEKVLGR